ncbi:MAG: putative metal-binding motif-containing protein [Pseudomonadota bacterium]|nr:putative metal-binding motif-containing protein [Pseudomonadota bacterium]
MLLPLVLVACASDIGITKQAQCDAVLQQQEDTVDAPFDVDGDGAFDGANPDCAATYAAIDLDCDDADPEIRPGKPELECNGVDDDCDPATPDGEDVDADGYTACEDCADAVAEVSPGALEVACNSLDDDCDEATLDGADADGDGLTACTDCDDTDAAVVGDFTVDLDGDGWTQCNDCDDTDIDAFPGGSEVCDNAVDDDCNGLVDDGCVSDYTDTWSLDDTIAYTCTFGVVTMDFERVLITDAYPDVTVNSLGSGAQPGEMTGVFTSSTAFSAEQVVRGSCTEVYTFAAEFTSMTTFDGTFTADFVGSGCFDCASQSWSFTGSR